MSQFDTNEAALFTYHCWESEQSTDVHLWKKSGQRVLVMRMLTKQENENDGIRMYRVRFLDRLEADVFEDELSKGKGAQTP